MRWPIRLDLISEGVKALGDRSNFASKGRDLVGEFEREGVELVGLGFVHRCEEIVRCQRWCIG